MNKHMQARIDALVSQGVQVLSVERRAGSHYRIDLRLPDGREAFMFTSQSEASHEAWTRWCVNARRLGEGRDVKGVTFKRASAT